MINPNAWNIENTEWRKTPDSGNGENTGLKNTGENEIINRTQLETNELIRTKREQEKPNKDGGRNWVKEHMAQRQTQNRQLFCD